MADEKRFRVAGTLRIEFDTFVYAKDKASARDIVEGRPTICLDGAIDEDLDFDEVIEVGDDELGESK
jgi:hypothetical protein